ncbi:MAG: gamma-glutamylcyclotransferase [Bacteroidota bacterium]|nr:gamma-glutamylcyclotransferase [Bacteroidota bacterium]
MKNSITKLFVYGTLRSGFHHPAFQYIEKHFQIVGAATVQGKLYNMGDFPAAVPTSNKVFIKGELYELKEAGEFEWAIEKLDDYEGINPAEGETKLYSRKLTEVNYDGGVTLGWIYWYNQELTGQSLIPSGDIFDKTTHESQV